MDGFQSEIDTAKYRVFEHDIAALQRCRSPKHAAVNQTHLILILRPVSCQLSSVQINSAKSRLELNLFGIYCDKITRDRFATQSIGSAGLVLLKSVTRTKRNRRNQLQINLALPQGLDEHGELVVLESKDAAGPAFSIAKTDEIGSSELHPDVSTHEIQIAPSDFFAADEERAIFEAERAGLFAGRRGGGIGVE
jgi:hypothetical protein